MKDRAPNAEQARYWNGDEGAQWLTHNARYDEMLAPFTDHLLAAATVGKTDRVLDIGCGCGSSTRAAGGLATEGDVLGVDLSRQLLQLAERRTREEGLETVRFEHADAQVHPFGPSTFDLEISRFGVMFFEDPAAAFTNIARSLRPAGRLAIVCWAPVIDNEWITVPGAAAAEHVPLPDPGEPGGPGPFSLADPDRLSSILGRAGLVDVDIESLEVPLRLGADAIDAVEFLKDTRMGRELLQDADQMTVEKVTGALEAALGRYLTPRGIQLGSRSWRVTARRPA